jgi:hypothetical protein
VADSLTGACRPLAVVADLEFLDWLRWELAECLLWATACLWAVAILSRVL